MYTISISYASIHLTTPMNKKGIIAAVLVLAVLAGLGYYFGGDSLQGRFDKISSGPKSGPSASTTTSFGGKKTGSSSSSSSGTTTVTESTREILLTVTPDDAYNTVTLSEVDWADEDSQWYAVGKFNYEYADDISICGDVQLMLNDGTTSYQYQSWFNDAFSQTRLQFRNAAGDISSAQYVYPNNSGEDNFEIEGQGLPTEGYFYVEVRAMESVASNYKNKKLYVYLSQMCAEKDSDTYLWDRADGNSENSYFSITADAVSGLKGGWAKILD